jgi:two-component system response regulator ChvI
MAPYNNGRSTPIALVDDDPLYCEAMAGALMDRGFAVEIYLDGRAFLIAMEQGLDIRLVLLDWTLPGMTGLAVLAELRRRGVAVPVVFLTGASPVERELAALRQGAVDFVDKGRGVEVLAPRLRRLIGVAPASPEPLTHGDLVLHPGSARAEWRGRDLDLTLSEYKVVAMLVAAEGKGVTYRSIYDEVHYEGFVSGWGDQGYRVNVRGIMKRIRRKFWKIDPAFEEIRNVAKTGYSWRSAAAAGGSARENAGVDGRPADTTTESWPSE